MQSCFAFSYLISFIDLLHSRLLLREIEDFYQHPEAVSFAWLAQLFAMIASSILCSEFWASRPYGNNSGEVSATLAIKQASRYHVISGWAIVASRYRLHISRETLTAFVLYIEYDYFNSPTTHASSYFTFGILMRLMLKMGMHRDPDVHGLPDFEGEMRRRLWATACHMDLTVSFLSGLPSVASSVESDTRMPINIVDDDWWDFELNGVAHLPLPPALPLAQATPLQYALCKGFLMRQFGRTAALSHRIVPPTHDAVMDLESGISHAWDSIPADLKHNPLVKTPSDPPLTIVYRVKLALVFHKTRCVLHRPYLADPSPLSVHDVSRQACLDSALALLNILIEIFDQVTPGGKFHPYGYLLISQSSHDFLLAAMMLYLVLQNEHAGVPDEWRRGVPEQKRKSSDEMMALLHRVRDIWHTTSTKVPKITKPVEIMTGIMAKLAAARQIVKSEPIVYEFDSHHQQPQQPQQHHHQLRHADYQSPPIKTRQHQHQQQHPQQHPQQQSNYTVSLCSEVAPSMGDMCYQSDNMPYQSTAASITATVPPVLQTPPSYSIPMTQLGQVPVTGKPSNLVCVAFC